MKQLSIIFTLVCGFVAAACAPQAQPPATPLPAPTPVVISTASNSPPAPKIVRARLNENFILHVQETAILADAPDQFGITFWNVKDDSRCPQGVVCVWAGEVRVQITFQENGLQHPPILELTTTPNADDHARVIEGYRVELVGVQPPLVQGKPIAREEYAATFRVTRVEPTPTPVTNAITGALDQPLTLQFLQRVQFPQAGMSVMFNGVVDDSRCPKNVNCFQAGRALVAFTLERNQRLGMFQLSTNPPDGRTRAFFQGYALELLGVNPYPEAPDIKIAPRDYRVTIVLKQLAPPRVANKNQGFALKVGETAQIADENVHVKFVRVQKDSRCPIYLACAVRGNAVVEATLAHADGTAQTFILNEDGGTPNQRVPDTGNFAIELIGLTPYPRADGKLRTIPQNEYEATFVVRKFASARTPTRAPTPNAQGACAYLTRQDAEALMGQPAQENASNAIIVRAVEEGFALDKNDAYGLCGYVSKEFTFQDQMIVSEPQLFASTAADYGVVAGRLMGRNTLGLLRVADIVRAANPNVNETPYLMLATRLAAGDSSDVLQSLREMANGAPQMNVERVDSFGDEGVWVWRSGIRANYAALLARDGDTFFVIQAILNKRLGESAARESMRAVMSKLAR